MATVTSNLIVRLLDKASGPARNIAKSLAGITDAAKGGRSGAMVDRLSDAINRNNRALEKARGRLVDATAGFAMLAGGIAAPLNAAMALEEKMADIAKVSGMSGAQLDGFRDKLRNMAKREIPLAVEELGDLAAAAAQSGINNDDLEEFTRMVAKSAVAWEMAGGETGEALAKIKTALGMTIEETRAYSDAINYLSDTSASSAADLVEFSRRVAADGKVAGFTNTEVLALGSTMISMGAQADVAATSLRNAGRMLSRGASATKRQRAAFEQLGMSAEAVAEAMPTDASGTLLKVLDAISKSPAHERLSLMSQIFGDEARALMPLLSELEQTKQALKGVADETNYLGSVQKEFETRSKTGKYALQKFKNQVRDLGIVVGNALLPAMKAMLEAVAPVLLRVSQWAEANPKLVASIVGVVGGLMAFKTAAIVVNYATLLARGGILSTLLPLAKAAKAARVAAAANIAYQTSLAGGKLSKGGKMRAGFMGIVQAIPVLGKVPQVLQKIGGMLPAVFGRIGSMLGGVILRGLALLAGPVGWAVLAASAAALIYKYREQIKAAWDNHIVPWFREAWQKVKDAIASIDWRETALQAIEKIAYGLGYGWVKLQQWWSDAWEALGTFVTNIDWAAVGRAAGLAVANGFTGGLAGRLTGQSVGNIMKGAIASGAKAASFWEDTKARSGSAFAQGMRDARNVAGARARGGPVTKGKTYLVGEEGPELWQASGNGRIIPNDRTMAALQPSSSASKAGGAGAGPVVNLTANFYGVTEREEILRELAEAMRREAESALRGIHGDYGVA